MEWISVKDKLPEKKGVYHVQRDFSEDFKACGQCSFDGVKFVDLVEGGAGEITHFGDEVNVLGVF